MASGTPLTDADRWPWLSAVAARIVAEPAPLVVVSCSSLKHGYRGLLRAKAGRPVRFLYLHGTEAVLAERMNAREGHFMPPALLARRPPLTTRAASPAWPPSRSAHRSTR